MTMPYFLDPFLITECKAVTFRQDYRYSDFLANAKLLSYLCLQKQ
jgi:hypothetical protein